MVNGIRLISVAWAARRALSTKSGKQLHGLAVAEAADQDNAKEIIIRKSFSEVQKEQQEQAKHSVLIQIQAKTSEKNFLKYLSRHGTIAKHFFFESSGTYAVVEFVDKQSINSLLGGARIPRDEETFVVPFKSRFIKVKPQNSDQEFLNSCSLSPVATSTLTTKLHAAENIEAQAQILLEEHQLTEESIRVRFLVGSLISDIATAIFPEATISLYGSSVNSFGKMGCDLDLFLDLDSIKSHSTGIGPGNYMAEYWMKRVSSARVMQQKILTVLGECIDSFGPGCNEVQKILSARCPLLRFSHQSTGLRCDLTADNRIALRSSELLYIYGTIDSRVRALVFTLRCWARVRGITSSIPGQWITNFSLTLMMLFFLQKRTPRIIPTLDYLKSLASKKDKCIVDGNDCTFVNDPNKIKSSTNTESIEKLLIEFLEFYGNFDFSKNGIDIRKGVVRNKPEAAPLYIQNPFEPELNVSKNVNQTHMDRFIRLIQESSWTLQEQMKRSSEGSSEPWGLAAILQPSDTDNAPTKKKRLASERLGSLLESLNSGKTPKLVVK